MGKEAMFTRTVKETRSKCLIANTETQEITTGDITVVGEFKKIDKLKAAISSTLPGNQALLKIIGEPEAVETLYGMTVADFVKHAEVLPPRSVKEN